MSRENDSVIFKLLKSADVINDDTQEISQQFDGESYPKLPEASMLELGEVTLNIAKDYEVIAIKNNEGEIVYLPFNVAIRLLTLEGDVADLAQYTMESVETLSAATVSIYNNLEEFKVEISNRLTQEIKKITDIIPNDTTSGNPLTNEAFVNSSISTNTATFRGTFNLVSDLHLTASATTYEIAAALADVIPTSDNNDYSFVQIPTLDGEVTEIQRVDRYKYNGTNWVFEYSLNNSGFTAKQWAAINSGIVNGLVVKLEDLPDKAALDTLLNSKQDVLTFDDTPTLGSTNPVTSDGIKVAIDDETERAMEAERSNANALNKFIQDMNAVIPSGTSSSNKLINESQKGAANGIASLGPNGKVLGEQLNFTFRGRINASMINDNSLEAGMYSIIGQNISGIFNNANGCLIQISDEYHTQILCVGRAPGTAEGTVVETFVRRYLNSTNSWTEWSSYYTKTQIDNLLNQKQPTLVSGTNIKTINSQSILGSGNIDTQEVFIGDYGVTSTTDIEAARTGGKIVMMRVGVGDGTFVFSNMDYSYDQMGEYVFVALTSGNIAWFNVGSTRGYSPIQSLEVQSKLTFDNTPTSGSTNPVTSDGIKTALDAKQDTLVSGTNIKTINNQSVLGSGNLDVKDTFWVEYYTTPFADILAAYNAGKTLFANYAGMKFVNTAVGIENDSNAFLFSMSSVDENDKIFIFSFSVTLNNGSTDYSNIYSKMLQEELISGTNIKTINGNSILGSGNIDVKDIFIVEYNVTTYSQILNAYNAGKYLVLKYNLHGHEYPDDWRLLPLEDVVISIDGATAGTYIFTFSAIYNNYSFLCNIGIDGYSQTTTNLQEELTFDNTPTANSDNPVKSSGIKTALDNKQNKIDSTHKLSADFVDDSTTTHKFVTTNEKETWNNKANVVDGKVQAMGLEVLDTSPIVDVITVPLYGGYPTPVFAVNNIGNVIIIGTNGLDDINFAWGERDFVSIVKLERQGKLAETAYQKPQSGIPASDIAQGVIPDVSNFITRTVDDLANYYLKSETYTKSEVQGLIGAIQQFHYEIYPALPQSGESNVLYLIGPAGSGNDRYEEYVYANGTFVKIGDTSIDLSGYVTTQALNTALANYVTSSALATALATKQDTLVSGVNIKTINSNSVLGSGNLDVKDVFIVEYEVTTYQDVVNAYNAGKYLILKYSLPSMSEDYRLLLLEDVTLSIDGVTQGTYSFTFSAISGTRSYSVHLTTNGYEPDITYVLQQELTFDIAPTANSYNPVISSGIKTALDNKQDKLVSGTNIKTINNTSVLGSGNLTLENSSNKTNDIANNDADTTKYPSCKAVADYVGAIVGDINSILETI